MAISASRTGEQLVPVLAGRMDGTGAQQVIAAIQQNLTDHGTDLLFDLGGVDNLRSAGLRTFQESARRIKERNGRIAVCRLQDFVRKRFISGGFLRILPDYPPLKLRLPALPERPHPRPGMWRLQVRDGQYQDSVSQVPRGPLPWPATSPPSMQEK